jgi:hypothetical protein
MRVGGCLGDGLLAPFRRLGGYRRGREAIRLAVVNQPE